MKQLEIKSQPNFFPGQWIDYRDFNRLVIHTQDTLAGALKCLYPAGGILSGHLKEFKVSVDGAFGVTIESGVALLPNGEVSYLPEATQVDLSLFQDLDHEVSIRVCLKNRCHGEDHTVDPEDASVSGYRTTRIQGEIEIGIGKHVENAIELFRVQMGPGLSSLYDASSDDWELARLGQIDLHSRKRIEPYSSLAAEGEKFWFWRRALLRLENSLFKILKMYLVEDYFQVGVFVSLLHQEILSRPFQIARAQFLLEEVAARLSLFLDRWMRESGAQLHSSDREAILQILPYLEGLRKKEFVHTRFKIDELIPAIDLLEKYLDSSGGGVDFISRIRSALIEWNNIPYEYFQKMTWAGYLFEKVDHVEPDDEKKVVIRSSEHQLRHQSASYLNGDSATLPGVFIAGGEVEASVSVRSIDRPLVLLLRYYIRRNDLTVQYEWNGKWIHSEQFSDADYQNRWVNRALVLPSESLLLGENRLTLKVGDQIRDFGFFGVGAYQGSSNGVLSYFGVAHD